MAHTQGHLERDARWLSAEVVGGHRVFGRCVDHGKWRYRRARNEGLSQTGIVEVTGIDRSTLADIVRWLVKKKLLQRRRTRQDARAYAVTVTDEGWRVLRAAEPVARRVDQRVLDALPTGHREQFIASLLAIVNALQVIAPPGKQRAG